MDIPRKKAAAPGGQPPLDYEQAAFHLQLLSSSLELPVAEGVTAPYRIIGEQQLRAMRWHAQLSPTDLPPPSRPFNASTPAAFFAAGNSSLVLLPRHADMLVCTFVEQWAAGRAGIVPAAQHPRLFYSAAGCFRGICDHLAVPRSCPAFSCSCDGACSCLNPWGASRCPGCGLAPPSDPVPALSDDHSSCSVGQETYGLGDLVWLLPQGADEAHADNQLQRASTAAAAAAAAVVWLLLSKQWAQTEADYTQLAKPAYVPPPPPTLPQGRITSLCRVFSLDDSQEAMQARPAV